MKLQATVVVLTGLAATAILLNVLEPAKTVPPTVAKSDGARFTPSVTPPTTVTAHSPTELEIHAYFDKNRPLLMNDDYNGNRVAFEKLAQRVENSAYEFDQALSLLKSDPEISRKVAVFADAAGKAGSGAARLVTAVALDLLREENDPDIRHLALAALTKFPASDSATIELVGQVAREDAVDHLRRSAASTLAAWMQERSASRDQLSAQLIQVFYASQDNELRGDAIRSLISNHPELSPSLQKAVADFLATSPTPGNRLLVAAAMGAENPETKTFALEQLRTAYTEESNIDIRRNILLEIVRFGGANAGEWMQQLPSDSPLLAQDMKDYQQILQTGETDLARIQELKFTLETQRESAQVQP